ncbi:MAG: 2-polyprenylphenol 6-hydroxylase [Aestuariivirga sp.]|uniref:2-polyprenylphenol 6-hydroxylase n=1 Tax=Aestuariivirga sp. TaxID=2650926 RepID=UPI0025C527AD|nr:2-polyprenylphenol 6-hydroxylase [Aestuariivirga sp.]MCA3562177.1 2-polyprenylphenol 6-hydroxylase [Aestuariivirga sp.]
MYSQIRHSLALLRAGRTLAAYDALMTPEQIHQLPWAARLGLSIAKIGTRKPGNSGNMAVAAALSSLGPSYIKLGQFLATRPDLVGPRRAFELKALQDRLPPFPTETAEEIIRGNLGAPVEVLFTAFGPPVAAASIAQVHKARGADGREFAVKVLRPGVGKRFAADLGSFYFAARLMERFSAEGRRLRPVAAVHMLEQSMRQELDLRMEAAALSEMSQNTKNDPGFRVPRVNWECTGRDVLTTEWIDGTPIADVEALRAQGFDLVKLGDTVIQSFLRHAIRDGFFHADMHQGNLFVDRSGNLVAVDFGIVGRLGPKESMFLAEILYGFITRNYLRVSEVHFEAGYVPRHHDPAVFAQAIRSIGEPIMDRPANQISMARLLTQLFEITAQFDMQTQPQLLLLQKTMVVVEGVARTLNPDLNMWVTAEPVVGGWIKRQLGPAGKLEEAAGSLGQVFTGLPAMLEDAKRATTMLSDMAATGGLRLDRETTEQLALSQSRHARWTRFWLALGAISLAAIAIKLIT